MVGPTGPAGGEVTQWLSFDTGNVRIKASGSSGALASITATKDFSVASVSRLLLTVPSGAFISSVNATFTAAETVGRTELRVEMPEPNGSVIAATSVRPIAFRLTSIYGVGATASTFANTAGTLVIGLTGYTGGAEQKAVVLV